MSVWTEEINEDSWEMVAVPRRFIAKFPMRYIAPSVIGSVMVLETNERGLTPAEVSVFIRSFEIEIESTYKFTGEVRYSN